MYGAVVLLLALVAPIGGMGGGSQRWPNLDPTVLQPSELMKPAIVRALAAFYHSLPAGLTGSWSALVPPAILIAIPVGLILLQQDLGTALAITFGGAVVMFLAGLPGRWFFGAAITAASAVPLAYLFALHDYQRRRVTTSLDPESDRWALAITSLNPRSPSGPVA